jgi:NitT/TauT family transport system ATP-binding protein
VPVVDVRNLSVLFPNGNGGLKALVDVRFQVYPQEFVCVLGPSGSGKSTLLRTLAGLLQPTSGEVVFAPGIACCPRPKIGVVFQQANLMPWRSALENITLPLELQGMSVRGRPSPEARQRAQEMIELVGLQGFETSWPRDLSGGMAQRVAIARALIQDPDLLLLDEPFGSLDALTRERMGSELLHIWQMRRNTVLMVTHSISEALFLSDRVLVLSSRPGRVHLDLQVDLPRPRQDEMRYTPHFGRLARTLRASIGV